MCEMGERVGRHEPPVTKQVSPGSELRSSMTIGGPTVL